MVPHRTACFASLRLAMACSICMGWPVTEVVSAAEPTLTGQTGFISMPDARVAPDGTWRTGFSVLRPYESIWSSISLFPWLEASGRYTRLMGVRPRLIDPSREDDYGDFKDKAFDLKLRLWDESAWRPSVAVGVQDTFGTNLFRATYVAASKRWGGLDATLGYGKDRIDGLYGGLRYRPESLPGWSFLAEYDAYDYKNDPFGDESGAWKYSKGPVVAVTKEWNGAGVKLGAGHGEAILNAWLSVPLGEREFVPKFKEPPPYTKINPRPSEAQWGSDPAHRLRLAAALAAQDFRRVRIRYENQALAVTLTNIRISDMPRAVGRAARTALSFAPLETREIAVTYETASMPVATYRFTDVRLLQRYFNGMAGRAQLAPTVAIEYPQPGAGAGEDLEAALAAFEEPIPESALRAPAGPEFTLLARDDGTNSYKIRPALASYFNDASGAIKFDLSILGDYNRVLARGLVFESQARVTVWENVSDVTQPSDSTLPHVRTDIAEYKKGGTAKINRLLVNQYAQPAERTYARFSGGIYEEMYSGAGTQVMYVPPGAAWNVDLAVDWLRQRDYRGLFGHLDYSTVTAIASYHYRMAHGVTATLRGGRFLARDEGVRGELKRRFASGFEVGAWYTRTNGNDTTGPGSPDSPYYDKGVFMRLALDAMLAYDTQAVASMSLAPWTRDVGQMVVSPGDLARMLEKPLLLDMHEQDGLVRLADRTEAYDLPSLGTGPHDRPWPEFVVDDAAAMARSGRETSSWGVAGLAALGILASSALDERAYEAADKRRDSAKLDRLVKVGDALPVAAIAIAGVAALDSSRPRSSSTGIAALEAAGVAYAASWALKGAVGRARPTTGEGHTSFEPFTGDDAYHSFPSRHTAAMWAAVTPFAMEYDAPWLYGVAAVTNLGRIASREHWLSDTVAGALLGYGLGSLAWDARRGHARKNGPTVTVGPGSVALTWQAD